MREAWICEYVTWNLEALIPFLQQLHKWMSTTQAQLPLSLPRSLTFPMNMCSTHGAMQCKEMPFPLFQYHHRFCYCSDHKYTSK